MTALQLTVKNFMRIIPLYWLMLGMYLLGELIITGTTVEPWWNTALHFLFLNWMTPTLFSTGAGGSGYIAVLTLMWVLYPLFLRKMNNLGCAIAIGATCTSIGFLLYRLLFLLNGVAYHMPIATWEPWLWYIYRGIYSFFLGGIMYYLIKERTLDIVPNGLKIVCTILCAAAVVEKILESGSAQNGFIFAILSMILIALNIGRDVKNIKLLPIVGKYSMEVFVAHILAEYFLAYVIGVPYRGSRYLLWLIVLTIVMVFPLKKIGKLLSIGLNKLIQQGSILTKKVR